MLHGVQAGATAAFLSTLSLRRATHSASPWPTEYRDFYPRSPCGERRLLAGCPTLFDDLISIHALLAESDMLIAHPPCTYLSFLSTLSLRRATTAGFVQSTSPTFLSTLSLRRATETQSIVSAHFRHFYPRSPCGERPLVMKLPLRSEEFLSTLSLRRATSACRRHPPGSCYFYPRSPCGERHVIASRVYEGNRISIHALLAESDFIAHMVLLLIVLISIHALLAESDFSCFGY